MKIYAEVYGCPSSIADCESILGLLKQAKFEIVDSPEKADVNLIVTCVVKSATEMRMIRRIQFLTKLNKPLIVAGCMPAVMMRKIEKINPNASMVGPNAVQNIVNVVKKTLAGERVLAIGDLKHPNLCLPRIEKRKGVHITQIATGCDGSCSYCIVRLAKGKLFSYPLDTIVEDVKQAVKAGDKEIWLTSQDNAAYSHRGKNLSDVLKEICKIEGEFKIRVGMMNPTYVKEEKLLNELIEAYKDKKVQKFLHLPLQSGSDKILRAMRRGYGVEDFVKIVERFRKEIPDLYLSTDVIAGFPGEMGEDFQATVELIKKIKPNKVNISKFGARPGTEAAKMGQLPVETVNERSRNLHTLLARL